MQDNKSNNKRIAKNTGLLYFRMLLTMAITLYTSRVVLKQLGENDYGIYNVVGGIVTMFSIVSASLSSAISRFLTFELGKKNQERLRSIFSTSVLIQIGLWLIIAILVESIGVWFLNSKMNIAPERLPAANWVLQCSIITFGINMLSVPYNAAIIAHEKMQAFAYVSILEVVLKLAIAFLLYLSFFDSLIMYAILLVIAALIVRMTYGMYCTRHFEECKLEFRYDRGLLKEMLGYSGWNFIGSSSAILRDQGVNIVMNLFCGTAVNAARGIAVQVNTAVHGFSQNFMLAVNPQIIKSYASGNTEYMFDLAFRSAKLSYFLLYCLSLPLILEMDWILHLWLTIVPDYTTSFAILILAFGMLESISIPLQYMNQATGKLKVYQLTVGGIQMLNFPVAYLLLYLKLSPDSVYVAALCISQLCLLARLLILRRNIHLSIRKFIRTVYLPIIYVSIIGAIIPVGLELLEPSETLWIRLGICLIGFFSAVTAVYFVGCTRSEKSFITDKFSIILSKFKTKHA
jgi:O-antigen/teichoic acid export membrane protein